jgi:hypothetical protein
MERVVRRKASPVLVDPSMGNAVPLAASVVLLMDTVNQDGESFPSYRYTIADHSCAARKIMAHASEIENKVREL